MTKIHIIYASTSGNVEFVCETVAKLLTKKNFEIELHRAEVTNFSIIDKNDFFILAASTWDHGIINPFFDKLMKEIENANLSGKKAIFIGLGDTRYEKHYFNAGIETLKNLWKEKGGEEVGNTLKINGDPYDQEDKIKKWFENLELN